MWEITVRMPVMFFWWEDDAEDPWEAEVTTHKIITHTSICESMEKLVPSIQGNIDGFWEKAVRFAEAYDYDEDVRDCNQDIALDLKNDLERIQHYGWQYAQVIVIREVGECERMAVLGEAVAPTLLPRFS